MPSIAAIVLSSTLAFIIFVCFAAVVFHRKVDCQVCNFLNWLYLLSTVKVLITVLKFYPQVISNYNRKSTQGWNIYGTWLDLIGSVLSILQLVLDCRDQNDWNGIEGNFVKVALGLISGSYDVVFCVQHYLLYPGTGDDAVLRRKQEEGGVELSYSQLDATEHGIDQSIRGHVFNEGELDDDIEEIMLQDDYLENAQVTI